MVLQYGLKHRQMKNKQQETRIGVLKSSHTILINL